MALETTLLAHGLSRDEALPTAQLLAADIRAEGAAPAIVGVLDGRAIVGLTDEELARFLRTPDLPKANTSNLGIFVHRGQSAATTVSTTMELAARAGLSIFATGGLGGVHPGFGTRLDISADLAAFTRFPIAVVASGVKAILDVPSTRELLETLGVTVIGFRTDRFPAFYLRDGGEPVDARFDDEHELASFLRRELARTGRGILVANPIPTDAEIPAPQWQRWLEEARQRVAQDPARGTGRDATPALLAALHQVSAGATLRANIALVRSNARLAARLARSLAEESTR